MNEPPTAAAALPAGQSKEVPSAQEAIDLLLAAVEPLEAKIGLRKGTCGGLLREESDWSFAVKLCVVLEAALTEVLVSALHNDKVRSHLSNLSMGGRSGKLQLARALDVFSKEECDSAEQLLFVRNGFAHEVKNIGGSLASFAEGMGPDKRREFAGKLLMIQQPVAVWDLVDVRNGTDPFPKGIRFMLWVAGIMVLSKLATQHASAASVREMRRVRDLAFGAGMFPTAGAVGLSESGFATFASPAPAVLAAELERARSGGER